MTSFSDISDRLGDLGTFEVGADGTVLLGEPFTFDKDNIADFDF